jgi:O-antigen/teichoic acid export membrane protein
MTSATSIPVGAASRRRAGGAALRNLAWLTGDKVVSVVLGLAVFGLIARAYGPEGAGRFSYSAVVLQIGLSLALVCSSAAAMPRLCRLRDGAAARAVSNIFAVRLVGSTLAALVVAAYLVFAVDDPLRRTVALVMLLAVPLAEPFAAFSAYWISRNRNGKPVAARSVGLATRVAVVAAALWAGASAPLVALAWVAEAAIAAVLQAGFLRGVRPAGLLVRAVRLPRVRAYARFGLRFAVGLWLAQLFLRVDRLWLAERLNAHDFGLYATAMQLVEVWQHVAMMTAGAMAPAFLYRHLQRSQALRDHWRTLALLAGLGLAGLAGAVLVGRTLLTLVYGAPFAAGHGFLMAGFGAALLFCIDQFVQISITANNRPGVLAVKWATAIVVALATLVLATPHLGAYAGPLGLALGLLSSWAAVAWTYRIADRETA